jgi:hypothetical protein
MKFTTDRPYGAPEKAARKLVEIASAFLSGHSEHSKSTTRPSGICSLWLRWFSCRAPEISPTRRVVGTRNAPVRSRKRKNQ